MIAERSPSSLRPVAVQLQTVAEESPIGCCLVADRSKPHVVSNQSPILRQTAAETITDRTATYWWLIGDRICSGKIVAMVASQPQTYEGQTRILANTAKNYFIILFKTG